MSNEALIAFFTATVKAYTHSKGKLRRHIATVLRQITEEIITQEEKKDPNTVCPIYFMTSAEKEMVDQNKKIRSIKMIKDRTHYSLSECKQLVDAYQGRQPNA